MKTILALDLGTKFGYAIHTDECDASTLCSGAADLTRYKGCKTKPADHVGRSIEMFDDWVEWRVGSLEPDAICYEAVYRWMSSAASIAYGAYLGSVMEHASRNNIPVFGYSPTQIKKHWTGKGNAKKPDMLAEARRRWPNQEIMIDDEADALAILDLHLNQTTP